jgi:signal peptidase II
MPERWKACATAAVVFGLDRLTKWIVETRVSAFDAYPVIPGFFSIVHAQNRGAAFGIFADSASEWRTFFLIVLSLAATAFVGAMLWRAHSLNRLTFWGLALIMGGAAGNIFDRIVRGTVTDFLLLYLGEYQWPAFNVADSAVSVGAGMLILEMLKTGKQPART